MIFFLAALALVFILIYFLGQGRRHDEFQSRRQRYKERRQRAPERPIDPNFQFDQPPGAVEKERHGDPN